jgi:hypothetical protein
MPEDPNLEHETDEVKPETETPAPTIVETPIVKPEDTVDFWKQKFSDSSREAQLLVEAERQRQQAQQELTKDPTDSDYRAAFPDWDLLDDSQKADKRRLLNAERTASKAVQIAQQLQSKESWNTSLELAIASTPALQGKEDAFKKFASKPQYRNVPTELLVSSFLGNTAPADAPTSTPRPALLTGNGGPRTSEKPQHISAADLSALRKSDEKAYIAYVKTHPIDVDSL